MRSEGCRDEIREPGSFRRIKGLTKEAQMTNGGGNLTAAKIIIYGERYTLSIANPGSLELVVKSTALRSSGKMRGQNPQQVITKYEHVS